jgi:hypothetical protein
MGTAGIGAVNGFVPIVPVVPIDLLYRGKLGAFYPAAPRFPFDAVEKNWRWHSSAIPLCTDG